MIVAAVLIVAVSQLLVFRRLRATVLEMGGARKISGNILLMPVLVAVGACLALLSSQTFLWEFSQRSWQLGAWMATDPDRISVYAASLLGTVLSVGLILADDGRWSLTRPGTAMSPVEVLSGPDPILEPVSSINVSIRLLHRCKRQCLHRAGRGASIARAQGVR